MTYYISPYRNLARMSQVLDRMLDDTITEARPAERELVLSADVQSNDDGYEVKALVPGLEAEDVNIEILNNTVTIRGEFKVEELKDGKYLMSELPAGKFSRTITLPTALDTAKAEANIKNGVLKLHIPKAEAHRPKSIKISAN